VRYHLVPLGALGKQSKPGVRGHGKKKIERSPPALWGLSFRKEGEKEERNRGKE